MLELSPTIFKAYDIRGIVGKTLDIGIARKIGQAFGTAVRQRGDHKVIVGRDGRLSGPELVQALASGLQRAGCDVVDLGVVATPLLYFATNVLDANSGIMVTGSHNPPDYNGFKMVLAGEAIYGDAIQDLRVSIERADFASGNGSLSTYDIRGAYIERIVSDVQLARPMKIAVDCGNGVAGAFAGDLYRALGCEVTELFGEVDGTFPNHHPDPSEPHNLEALVQMVQRLDADLGIAFDGDGDRVLFVDGDGVVRDGDDLIYVLARDWQASGRLRGPVVGTLMSNFGLEQAMGGLGIDFIRANVGDRYVHQQLVANEGVLGGEASGHLLCLDRVSTGDGIVSALQVLEVLGRRGLSLSQALEGLRKVPQKTVNVRYAAGARPAEADSVKVALADAQQSVAGRGRAFLRPSGTEPVVRVTVEADDDALVQSTLERLAEAVRAAAA